MSRTAKALLIAGVLFVLGIVIGGVGFLSGGADALEENYGVNPVANSRSFSEPVRKLEISTVSDDVMLMPAEDGLCRVDWKDTRFGYYEVSLENGTLKLRYRDTEQKICFSFSESEPCAVAVYLPERDYESLLLTTTSGNFASSGFSFDETKLTTTSGEVGLENGFFGEAKINTTSGDVVLDCYDASTTEINTTSGSVVLHDYNAAATKIVTTSGAVGLGNGFFGEAKINTTSGDVVLDCYDASATEINTTSGNVTGTVAAPQTYHVHTVSGDVNCPEDAPGGTFEVHTTSGDVKLSAAE